MIRFPSLRRPPLVIAALVGMFAASGATSLVYETVWARQLHVVFGTSQLAICTLLAAFMGGLAAGGIVGGRWAIRTRRPLLAYAAVELGIGVYAIVFPWLVRVIEPLYLGFQGSVEPSPLVFGLFQFATLGLLLLPPTMGMGATLPLVTRFLAGGPEVAGRDVGRLYGANTLGAVLGAAAAGFILLPRLGLSTTTWAAAATNAAIAAGAVVLSMAHDAAAPVTPAMPATTEARERHDGVLSALLLVAAIAGFASLLYEVAWFRLLVLLLGGSAYAFTIMLLAFLLGIGLGGWMGGAAADRAARRGGMTRLLRSLAWIQVIVAVLAWCAMHAYRELPVAYVWAYDRLEDSPQLMWWVSVGLALAIMLPPTLLMGATFPFLVRAAAARNQPVAGAAGLLYGVNTLGAVVGAFAGGFFLLPSLNIRGTVLAAASLNLLAALLAVTGLIALRPARPRALLLRWTGGLLGGAVLLIVLAPAWPALLMSSGMYKYVQVLPERTRQGLLDFAVHRHDLLYYDEGLSSVVTVARHRETGNLWLANNGKVDASSHGDLRTQALLAHLPFMFRPQADQALVIGLASGITAGSVTQHEAPSRIDIVEIEPAVVRASHVFDNVNHRPLEDPRVRLFVNDARNHLLLTPDATYDLVTSEPSNPWLTGASNLFTTEFFALGKRKLKPGGVWAQWLQTYCMDVDDLRCLLATFADHYQHVRVFRMNSADLVLLGSDAPLPLDVAALSRFVASRPDVLDDLTRCDLPGAEDVLALFQIDRATIDRLAAGSVRNTDDNMRIEHSAPLHIFSRTREANSALIRGSAAVPLDAVPDEASLVRLGEAYVREGDLRRAEIVRDAAADPHDPAIRALARHIEDARPPGAPVPPDSPDS